MSTLHENMSWREFSDPATALARIPGIKSATNYALLQMIIVISLSLSAVHDSAFETYLT